MMSYISNVLELVRKRNPGEMEFLQTIEEVFGALEGVMERNPRYERERVMERIIEPERVFLFRVLWHDDQGAEQVNRGYDVEFSSVLGPYQGGIRFHTNVSLSVMKELAFEQVFRE